MTSPHRERVSVMPNVREYNSGKPVELWQVDGRLVVRATSDGGAVEIDLYDLVHWFRDTPQNGLAATENEAHS